MVLRSLLVGAVTSAAVTIGAPVYAATCPMLTPDLVAVTLTVALNPDGKTPVVPGQRLEEPKVGDHINVTIPLSSKGGTIVDLSACFDEVVVTLAPVDPKVRGLYVFTVPAVGDTAVGPLPINDHTFTVQWTYKISDTEKETKSDKHPILFKPALDGVHVATITKADRSYRVELVGAGSDQNAKDNNRIVMGSVDRNVCWTGTTGCTSPNGIRASVSPRKIVLERRSRRRSDRAIQGLLPRAVGRAVFCGAFGRHQGRVPGMCWQRHRAC